MEPSGWLQNVPDRTIYQITVTVTYDVPFLRHVSLIKRDVRMFSKFVNFVHFYLKIATHIDWTYAIHLSL